MEPPSVLHNPSSEFEDRNNFLYFTLGLISLSQSLIQRLDTETSESDVQLDSDDVDETRPDASSEIHNLLI